MVQGHRNPFGKSLVEYTVPQLDFVLEMAALDSPDAWSFVRSGAKDVPRSEVMSSWKDSLAGKALMSFMARTGLARAQRGIAAAHARRGGFTGMRPGLTRGGKPVGSILETGGAQGDGGDKGPG